MQNYIRLGEYTPPTPTELTASFATTSTQDSGRVMRGTMRNSPMFTVEAFTVKWERLTAADMSAILQKVIGKSSFMLYYFSPYYNSWQYKPFFVANVNNVEITSIRENNVKFNGLSFQMTGTEPI